MPSKPEPIGIGGVPPVRSIDFHCMHVRLLFQRRLQVTGQFDACPRKCGEGNPEAEGIGWDGGGGANGFVTEESSFRHVTMD